MGNFTSSCGFSSSSRAPFTTHSTISEATLTNSILPKPSNTTASDKTRTSQIDRNSPSKPISTRRADDVRPFIDFAALPALLSESQSPDEKSLWPILATTTLLATHKDLLVGELWTYIVSQTSDEQTLLSIARRIRETCLKCSVLVGFPHVRPSPFPETLT